VDRAAALASRLEAAAADLIAVVERIDEARWRRLPGNGVWSVSKDAEHIADATLYHQWIVRMTIGEKVSTQRPKIERARMESDLSPAEMVALIRERTEVGAGLLRGLTDAQLDTPTKPPRARGQLLAETIDQVLIDHYHGHRSEIEAKLRGM
jgi:uncharacterized damage-inducible protein DinB